MSAADDPHEWMAHGECNGADPALFFPERGDDVTVKQAKAVCATCPVRQECLEYAIAGAEKFGIWGGLSERERRRIRRTQYRALEQPVTCELPGCTTVYTRRSNGQKFCSDECSTTNLRNRKRAWEIANA